MKDIFKAYAPISKVDEEQRMVYGYASTDTKDSQGDIVKLDAIEAALPDYMKFANIREMHTMSAVGVAKAADVDDKGLYLAVKVVDDSAWAKVKEGVYKGFSIGGKALEKSMGVISKLRLTEISLVDRPANSECVIDMWKAEGGDDQQDQAGEPAAGAEGSQPTTVAKALTTYSADELRAALESVEKAATEAAAAAVNPTVNDIAKAASYEEGKPIWDSQRALEAMSAIFYIMSSEASEKVPEATQLAQLQAAIDSLKAFVIAELQERPEGEAVAMADGSGDDITKAGATFSKSTKDALAKVHGMLRECDKAMGAIGYDGEAKADGADDLAKATTVAAEVADLAKAAGVELTEGMLYADLAKAALSDLAKAAGRIKELEAAPAPAKAAVTAIEKSGDTKDGLADEAPAIDTNDPLSVMKAQLSRPMAFIG